MKTTGTSSRRSGRARRLGYTVVEVMMALAVLSIGATGVIAMQKAALIGNVRARNLATASAIASTWVERLRVDGLRWVLDKNGQSTIGQTRWLVAVGNDYPTVVNPEDVWLRPQDAPAEDISAQFDVIGRDTFVDAQAAFCTHIKLTQLTENTIRAEVRVFWLRYGDAPYDYENPLSGTFGVTTPLCADDPGYITQISSTAALFRYHFVYVATSIVRGTAP